MAASSSKLVRAPALVPASPGQRIGDKYVVLELIAQGGMAWVAAAKHVDLDEIVAIKFLKDEYSCQPEVVARFAREAKTAMQIRSDHCVRMMDVGSDPRVGPFIVMEHLRGHDLAGVIAKDGRIAPRRAADLVLQVCDALASAHVVGIIHRDVKPENVFVVEHGAMETVRVLDFGISKASVTGKVFNTDLSVLKTQSLLGSPVYMSPEQMRGEDVDMRADVWSVGATLFEAVAGQVAFNARSVTEICSLVLEGSPGPLPSELPRGLRNAILRCLEKDPADRYQNIAELAVALAPFAPSASRLWVERIVSISKSHGLRIAGPAMQPSSPPASEIPPASSQRGFGIDTADAGTRPNPEGAGKKRRVAHVLLALLLLGSLAGVAVRLRVDRRIHWRPAAASAPPPPAPPQVTPPPEPNGDAIAIASPAASAIRPAASAPPPSSASPPSPSPAPARPPRPRASPRPAAPPPPPLPSPPPVASPPPVPAEATPAPPAVKTGRARLVDDPPRPKLVD
jgi:serine/threonine-protein kinase